MGCRKGCGNDTHKIELITKDLIRQMVEDGQLQEGLVDCSDRRLRRDSRVLACDQVKEAFCQMLDSGDLCLTMPERVIVKESGHICLMMSDGSEICSITTVNNAVVERYEIDGYVAKLIFSDGTLGPTLDLTEAFESVMFRVTQDHDGSVTLRKDGMDDVTIPAIKVIAEKDHTGTVTITNQDGSQVTIDPVRQGDKGDQGEPGKSAYQIWLDNGNQGSESDFLTWLRNAENNHVGDGLSGNGTEGNPFTVKTAPQGGVTIGDDGVKIDKATLKPIATVKLVNAFDEVIGYAFAENERSDT